MLIKLKLEEFGFFTVKELKILNNQGIYSVEQFLNAECIKSKVGRHEFDNPRKLENFHEKSLKMLSLFE